PGIPGWFEGGQTPLHMRVPKLRGFKNRFRKTFVAVNVGRLADYAAEGKVSPDTLAAKGLIGKDARIKVLGDGVIGTKLEVHAHSVSATARQKIESAGGSIVIITPSIIMTLLNQTIPALERLSKEGEYGRNKINQYTRVLTVPLALLQGIGVAVFMQRQGVLNAFGPDALAPTLSLLASLTAGTIILMWLGELISERGIGNGISFIIFAGIVGRLPNTVEQTLQVQQNAIALISIAVIAVLVIAAIIFIQEGQRRIPVQYAKRVRGT